MNVDGRHCAQDAQRNQTIRIPDEARDVDVFEHSAVDGHQFDFDLDGTARLDYSRLRLESDADLVSVLACGLEEVETTDQEPGVVDVNVVDRGDSHVDEFFGTENCQRVVRSDGDVDFCDFVSDEAHGLHDEALTRARGTREQDQDGDPANRFLE